MLEQDPHRSPRSPARLFEGGHITLKPQPEGHYVGEGTFLPLVALARSTKPRRASGAEWYFDGCAGAISPMYAIICLRAEVRIAA